MISIENISKSFGEKQLFKNFSISIPQRRISCILGPSGCGKTTLLNIIAGLVAADSGNVYGTKGNTACVFQEDRLLPWATVRENLEFVIHGLKENINIDEYLETVQLSDFKDYFPDRLSGGMRQRVALARAFIYPADTLLMDEPFKGLDYKLKLKLFGFILDMWEMTKKTILFVTHDIDEALTLSHGIHLLAGSPAEVIKHWDIYSDSGVRNIRNIELQQLRTEILSYISD